MLRSRSVVRPLSRDQREAALRLCAQDPVTNVFVAARLQDWTGRGDQALAYLHRGELTAVCWANANVVPVAADEAARRALANALVSRRSRTASVFGPQEQVADLWDRLSPQWGTPRAVREAQPVLQLSRRPSELGFTLDERVRPARPGEVDLVLPAAAHMFTSEIGYAPYTGSPRFYRQALADLISRERTYVLIDRGEVVFKADIGSLALGCAQVQGVWMSPHLRGRGLAVPAFAAVVEDILVRVAPVVTLYVNDFNVPARRLYRRLGFAQHGTYQTVIL